MSWSKRRKKFNKTFDVEKHHRNLISAAVIKLVTSHCSARLEYHMLYGYPPYEGAPEFVEPPIIQELKERLLVLIYGK